MIDVKRSTWILLTTFGLAGGLVAGLIVGMPLGQILNAMIVTGIVTCVVGAVLGSLQAFGLRRLLRRPVWWIVATAIGIGAGLAAGVVFVEQTGILITGARPNIARLSIGMRAASMVAVGYIAGTALGLAQWLVFRKQGLPIRNWILVSGVGMALAFCASALVVDLSGLRFASAIGFVAFILLSGAAFGALTSWPFRTTSS